VEGSGHVPVEVLSRRLPGETEENTEKSVWVVGVLAGT
jgi:hypothetical protein